MRFRVFGKRNMLLAALALCLGASAVSAMDDTRAQKEAASLFASKGIATTLGACALPKTCAAMRPLKKEKFKRTTSNDFVVDQWTMTFDGLDIEFWCVLDVLASAGKPKNPYAHPQVLRLLVSKDRWPVAHGLKVGTSKALVVRKLGRGMEQGDCTEYVSDTEDVVRFCFRKDRVHSIEWIPWNDA